jgi:hypothetical protein
MFHNQPPQAAPGPLPPLPPLPSTSGPSSSSASPLAPLVSAIEEPGRLADAYAAARNTAAAQQWADATAAKGKKATDTPVALPPSAAAAKPLVVASARAAAGAPNPTAGTTVRTGQPPADPVEAVVEAGADAVSGRPPRLLDLLRPGGGGGGDGGGGGHRRLLATAAVKEAKAPAADADVDADAAPAPKPRLSKYKLFKTADPHRVSLCFCFFLDESRRGLGLYSPGPPLSPHSTPRSRTRNTTTSLQGAAAGLASILPPHVSLPALPGRR